MKDKQKEQKAVNDLKSQIPPIVEKIRDAGLLIWYACDDRLEDRPAGFAAVRQLLEEAAEMVSRLEKPDA